MTEPNLGEQIAAVDEARSMTVADFVKNSNVLMYLMDKEGNVTEDFDGRLAYEPFEYAQNAAYQAINPTEEVNLTFTPSLDVFSYGPKISVCPILITELEKAQSRTKAARIKLLKQRSENSDKTMKNEINSDLNGDGSGRSGKAFNGIKSYISDTGAATVGGVSMSSFPVIANVYQDLSNFESNGDTDSGNIEDRVLYLKNQISVPGDDAFIGYAGAKYFRHMASAVRGRVDLTNEDLTMKGFGDHIVVEGIPFFRAAGYNPQSGTVIAADRMYIIHPAAFGFRTYKGYNMQALDKRVSTKQLVDVALRVCFGQFTCKNPGRNAVGFSS